MADYKKNWKYFSGFLIHDVPSDSSMLYPKSLATAICLFYTLSGALPWLHRCPSLIWAVVSNGRLHGHFVGWTVEEPVQTCPGQHGTLPALGQAHQGQQQTHRQPGQRGPREGGRGHGALCALWSRQAQRRGGVEEEGLNGRCTTAHEHQIHRG